MNGDIVLQYDSGAIEAHLITDYEVQGIYRLYADTMDGSRRIMAENVEEAREMALEIIAGLEEARGKIEG